MLAFNKQFKRQTVEQEWLYTYQNSRLAVHALK